MSDAVTISDDYAVLHAGGLRFYYGYEYTIVTYDKNNDVCNEWCFVVHRLDTKPFTELFRLPESKLVLPSGTDPVEFLLEGIARWMDRQVESK